MEQIILENYIEARIEQSEYNFLINYLKMKIESNDYIDRDDLKRILISLGIEFE